MNTRILCDLMRARIREARQLNLLQKERPPCVPRIRAEREVLEMIDARLARETGREAGRAPC